MAGSRVEATEASRTPRRFGYLIDIVVLVAVTFLLDAVLGAFIPAPIDWEKGFVFDAIGKMLLVGVAWGLIRLRGETLADIGLKRPASWMRTFMIGIGLAVALAVLFGASRGAWIVACVVQGALFGAAHAYQNPLGIMITGTLGVLMGLLVLASGRNLWPVIIGHGLFDASRFVLFYFQGPPIG